MGRLLVAAIVSGRLISRIGRYKVFPIVGTAILLGGMFLLSRLGVGTAPWLASAYLVVVGVGIGLVMQVLVLVVQNDAQSRQIGVATSTATFFRSVGGSVGVALSVRSSLHGWPARWRSSPESREVARRAASISGPRRRRKLPPEVHAGLPEHLRALAPRGLSLGQWRWRSCRSGSRGCCKRSPCARLFHNPDEPLPEAVG